MVKLSVRRRRIGLRADDRAGRGVQAPWRSGGEAEVFGVRGCRAGAGRGRVVREPPDGDPTR